MQVYCWRGTINYFNVLCVLGSQMIRMRTVSYKKVKHFSSLFTIYLVIMFATRLKVYSIYNLLVVQNMDLFFIICNFFDYHERKVFILCKNLQISRSSRSSRRHLFCFFNLFDHYVHCTDSLSQSSILCNGI